MSDFLVAKDLHKVYDDGATNLHVIKGINLTVKRPSFVAIVGPSGAGKSTLLHLLGGLDKPTRGEVIFEGRVISKLSDSGLAEIRNRRIGFVFQFYHLLSEFTAVENVLLPAIVRGKHSEKRAFELLQTVGLAERSRHRPSELSGGEQQRVAIARALINDPDILFCDEPTGNLDSETGSQMMQLIADLNRKEKKTLVVVTHEEKLAAFADEIYHIRDGAIQGAS